MSRDSNTCVRCIMDTTDPAIRFFGDGVCNHCEQALERIRREVPPIERRAKALESLADKIRSAGRSKEFDCIIGVSGGVDSTSVAYHVRKLGLRTLAVHFDNGWNSELAVNNIRNTLERLQIELYTHVVDWEEFRDLQISFLKASVVNCEMPSDHGIFAILFRMANKLGIKYILSGSNLATESIMPYSWTFYSQDSKHLVAIQRQFGQKKLLTMPLISVPDYLYYVFYRGIRQIPLLNYIDYNKDDAKKMLASEIGWRDYGGKHYESVWTRFYQGYYLPTKFGFDKRRAHYSSMICSGLMTREQALEEIKKPIYPENLLEEDKRFVLKKFTLSQEAFDKLLHLPPKKHTDYPSNYVLFHRLRTFKEMFRRFAATP